MPSRVERAAATRRAVLEAAGALLDGGGRDAVTLRGIGARSGVSRSAAYRHFTDKEDLLAALAAESWDRLADEFERLRAESRLEPERRARQAVLALVVVGRRSPDRYRLMHTASVARSPLAARAATRAHDRFLDIVTEVVGPDRAAAAGGLLLAAAHGLIDLELSGLDPGPLLTVPEDLVDLQVAMLAAG